MQTDQPKTAQKRQKVLGPGLHGARRLALQNHPKQLRGARHPGPRVQAGLAHRQQLSVKGQLFTESLFTNSVVSSVYM